MKYQLGNNETFELIWPDGKKVGINKSNVGEEGDYSLFATKGFVLEVANYQAMTASLSLYSTTETFIANKETLSIREWGASITTVTLKYSFSKKAKGISLTDYSGLTESSGTVDISYTSGIPSTIYRDDNDNEKLPAKKTWTLKGTEDYTPPGKPGGEKSASVSLSFYGRIYYGAADFPGNANIDADFITGLSSSYLASSRSANSSVGSDKPSKMSGTGTQYFWFAVPKIYGDVTFAAGGFVTAFTKYEVTKVKNAHQYEVDYYLYCSPNPNQNGISLEIS